MAGRRRGIRRAAGLLVLAVLALVASGCGATATVAVRIAADGSGTVGVRVVVDRAALTEIGGLGQLRTADLVAAGWRVSGPDPATGGGATVQASHPFRDPAGLSALLASVASTRVGGHHVTVFTLAVRTSRSTTTVTGRVDLTCGIDCFGDTGLRRVYGSDVGVDPRRIGGAGGDAAARDLHVILTLQLPGSVRHTDATSRRPLTWAVPLGTSAPVAATAVNPVTGHRQVARTPVLVTVGVATVVIALAALSVMAARRRRRTRVTAGRTGRRRRG